MSLEIINRETGTKTNVDRDIQMGLGLIPRPEGVATFPLPRIETPTHKFTAIASAAVMREALHPVEGERNTVIFHGKEINKNRPKDSAEVIVWHSDPIMVRFAEAFKRKLPVAATIFAAVAGGRE